MYFGITNTLAGKTEYGEELEKERVQRVAERMRELVLETSPFKEENLKLWEEYYKTHPWDKTAIFMCGERTPG